MRSRNPFQRRRDLFGILARKFSPRIHFILLERAIETNLRRIIRPSTQTAVLEHPAEQDTGAALPPGTGRLRIAFIGATARPKGFPVFVAAARRGNPAAGFHVIGMATEGYDDSLDSLFETPPARAKLSQAEFEAGVRAADLVCLPLDPVHYGWSASGTLLDCIRFRRVPLTVRTAVTSELEARYGRFGYLVDGNAAMTQFLANIDRPQVAADLPAFTAALGRIAHDRTIKALAAGFALNGG